MHALVVALLRYRQLRPPHDDRRIRSTSLSPFCFTFFYILLSSTGKGTFFLSCLKANNDLVASSGVMMGTGGWHDVELAKRFKQALQLQAQNLSPSIKTMMAAAEVMKVLSFTPFPLRCTYNCLSVLRYLKEYVLAIEFVLKKLLEDGAGPPTPRLRLSPRRPRPGLTPKQQGRGRDLSFHDRDRGQNPNRYHSNKTKMYKTSQYYRK